MSSDWGTHFAGQVMHALAKTNKQTNKQKLSNAGYAGLIPGPGRFHGEGNGNPLQCSCPRNPRGEGNRHTTRA